MGLQAKKLQVIDVMDIVVKDLSTGATVFTGTATKTGLSNTVDTIDIYGGIGNQKLSSFKTKKTTTMDISIAEFSLDYLSMVNGVAIDSTATGTYYVDAEVTVTTLAATVTDATRIIAVRKTDGTVLKLITGTPAALGEVKVAGDDLTFYTGFSDAKVLVTYEAPAASGKENLTVVFNSKAFPNNAEIVGHTVVFDGDTNAVVADLYINFYSAAIDGAFDWSFEAGKNIESALKLEILTPKLLPSGAANTDGDTGVMKVTAR